MNKRKPKPFTADELATSLGLPRSFDRTEAPPDYWPRFYWSVRYDIANRRFRLRLFNGAPWAGAIVLTVWHAIVLALVLT